MGNNNPLYMTDIVNKLDTDSQKIVQALNNVGFCLLKQCFEHSLIDEAIEGCKKNISVNLSIKMKIEESLMLGNFSDAVPEIACDKGIESFLPSIYGGRAFPFHTLTFDIEIE